MLQRTFSIVLLLLLFFSVGIAQQAKLSAYNIRWLSPGLNSQGSMPLGNGDIGINAWADEKGNILFYVSKTDSWSENGQLLKLGLVRINLSPNPFNTTVFSQELSLENGEITINYGTAKLKIWVDANHPTIQVDIVSKTPVQVSVFSECWRRERCQIKGAETSAVYGVAEVGKDKDFMEPVFREPDTILPPVKNAIFNCHHNSYSQWKRNLELQALNEFAATNNDPLLNRTFGMSIEGKQFISDSDTSLVSKKPGFHWQLNVYPLTQLSTIAEWKQTLLNNKVSINTIPQLKRRSAHHLWWKQFWNRNYIFVASKDPSTSHEAEVVTRGYILQRFINACGGRGGSPIKFNGSIFTVDTYNRQGANAGLNADFRAWGGPYWWQNTRLIYWSMLVSGDFDMMNPLFKMYMKALPLRQQATKKYYGHDGAFFPETMNFWGTYTNSNYGVNRENLPDGYIINNYIRYYWSGGLELSLMMFDYYSFTRKEKFLKDTLIPFVSETLRFFSQHWKREANGKILFSPATSLETYPDAVNPLPEIAGISKVTELMLKLAGDYLSDRNREEWKKLLNDLPTIPVKVLNNDTLLTPAAKFNKRQNAENPELYAIFPYRVYGLGKPGLDLANKTFDARMQTVNGGWQQNSIQAAYLGRSSEAQKMLIESFSAVDKNFRFPAFWGPNYDWTPDQDNGCVAMIALQRMLIQYEDNNVYLLPAWPDDWNVDFKVNGPSNTTIRGKVKNGKLAELTVNPENKINLLGNIFVNPFYKTNH